MFLSYITQLLQSSHRIGLQPHLTQSKLKLFFNVLKMKKKKKELQKYEILEIHLHDLSSITTLSGNWAGNTKQLFSHHHS